MAEMDGPDGINVSRHPFVSMALCASEFCTRCRQPLKDNNEASAREFCQVAVEHLYAWNFGIGGRVPRMLVSVTNVDLCVQTMQKTSCLESLKRPN